MTEKKKSVFTDGPVSPDKIATSIAAHAAKTDIGAHSIFLGQVRDDLINGERVSAIEYSCYPEMAEEIFHTIREEAFSKFELRCLHIYHSIGIVSAGGISLFVFTSSMHRKAAIDSCAWIVEEIKSKAPVWGKEIMESGKHCWKTNTFNDQS